MPTMSPLRMTLLTAVAPATWGTTYIVTTELLPPDRPLLAGTLRALPVGLLLLAFTRVLPQGAWWFKALALGTLNIGAFFALLFVAAYRLPGGVAATLGAIQPLIVAGLAVALLDEAAGRQRVLAGLAAVAGVGLLVLKGNAVLDPVGILAGLAGTVSMGLGVVLTKRWGRPVPVLAFAGWQLTAGGVVLLPLVLAVEGLPPTLTQENVAGLVSLAAEPAGAEPDLRPGDPHVRLRQAGGGRGARPGGGRWLGLHALVLGDRPPQCTVGVVPRPPEPARRRHARCAGARADAHRAAGARVRTRPRRPGHRPAPPAPAETAPAAP